MTAVVAVRSRRARSGELAGDPGGERRVVGEVDGDDGGAGRGRGDAVEDVTREGDDVGRAAVADLEGDGGVVVAGELAQRVLPAVEGDAGVDLLRGIAGDDERGAGGEAAADEGELQRGELLGLVEHDEVVEGRGRGSHAAGGGAEAVELEEDGVVLGVDRAGVGRGGAGVERPAVDGDEAAAIGDVRPLLLGGARELDAGVLEDVVDHARGHGALRGLRDALEQEAVAEQVQEVRARRVLERAAARDLVEHDAQRGVALEARDARGRVLALAPREPRNARRACAAAHFSYASTSTSAPSRRSSGWSHRSSPSVGTMTHARGGSGRRPPQMRDAMQGDRRLAVPRLARGRAASAPPAASPRRAAPARARRR